MALSASIRMKFAASLEKMRPIDRKGAGRVGGRAGVNVLRKHFNRLDSERPNQLGGTRTHFWREVSRSVQQPRVEGDTITISINQVGVAQRLFGGTITPISGRYLTIPARAEAHGRRAREFDDLEILWGRRGPVALVQRNQTRLGRGKKAPRGEVGGTVFYWLVKSVTQKPDPTVLPTDDELGFEVARAVESFVDRQLQRGESE